MQEAVAANTGSNIATNTAAKTGSRNATMELLRMVSMLMICMLHALGKSNLLQPMTDPYSGNLFMAWILESLSISAVNIFMLISGYFLIRAKFRISRLVELVLQIVFYTAGAAVVCAAFGILSTEEVGVYWYLNYFLPVHMEVYWFMSAYILIYRISPLLSAGIQNISQKQLGTVILLLLTYECFFKSFLPFRTYTDTKGYSFLWCLTVFLIGAYFRTYGFPKPLKVSTSWLLYFLSAAAIFLESYALHYANNVMGRLKEISGFSLEYNNVFVLLAAIGIFAAFAQMKPITGGAAKVICFLSPMTLGVYLSHENMTIRYRWVKWAGLSESGCDPWYLFLGRLILAILAVYVAGTAIDYLRRLLFSGVAKLFRKK
jgi:surface polysaccharide O-acyltransferase-like enzyme